MTPDTQLYRQVHPDWIQNNGFPSSQAFRPTPKDNKRLSVYDGEQTSAEDSWKHYTQQLKQISSGVIAVTIAECEEQGLTVKPDPNTFPAHVLIKFDGYSNSQIKKKAKNLKMAAESRTWRYEPKAMNNGT